MFVHVHSNKMEANSNLAVVSDPNTNYNTNAYLPTLPVFPGVSKFFMKSPSLLVRAPNLQETTYHGSFYISYSLIS